LEIFRLSYQNIYKVHTHIYTDMATKTISITTEAYERLASLKKHNESFSEIINLLTKKHSLLDLVGVLTHEEAASLRKSISETRKRLSKSLEKNSVRFQ